MIFSRIFIALLIALNPLFISLAVAEVQKDMRNYSGLPIPRFVSLKHGEVNARVGPGKDYPINWVYQRKGLPVEIIEEFGHWRKIRDREGAEGWLHHSLLSGVRSVIFAPPPPHKTALLYHKASESSKIMAEIENGVIAQLEECSKSWCKLKLDAAKGYSPRHQLWGLYADEVVEE